MSAYMNSQEAAAALGVQRQTLYAYVSRGLLQSLPGDDLRGSKFRAADVERLAAQKSYGRKPKQVAKATLDWGLPVMESALTLIEGGKLYYRGLALDDLIASASLEDVARLLWGSAAADPFSDAAPAPSSEWRKLLKTVKEKAVLERCMQLFSLGYGEIDAPIWQRDQDKSTQACAQLLRLFAASVLGAEPSGAPIHLQCRHVWRLDRKGADIVRVALIVCADHELNASSFTARCIASTGAGIGAAILGGVCALSGPKHGGFTWRVEAFLDELKTSRAFAEVIQARLERGETIPGFGHPLYPDGDPRARAIFARLPHNKTLERIVETVRKLTGQQPTIDFALVAARRHLQLPAGSAFAMFAIARAAGWIAHALEQRAQRSLIRPRASYVGPPPAADSGKSKSAKSGRIVRFGNR